MLTKKNITDAELIDLLEPFAQIADEYDRNALDQARPEWGDDLRPDQIELLAGRGGKQLLTLADAVKAREFRRGLLSRNGQAY